jgi:hypothetical protein
MAEHQEFIRRYSSFNERKKLNALDYRYKRGLLSEIHLVSQETAQHLALSSLAANRNKAQGLKERRLHQGKKEEQKN